jgi:uncharacterized membrane protein
MKGACDQVDHQEHQDRLEPQRVIHIEEVKKVQDLIETRSVSLNIFRTSGILCDQCTDNRKDSKQNEERNGKFEGPKKIKDDGKKSTSLRVDWYI